MGMSGYWWRYQMNLWTHISELYSDVIGPVNAPNGLRGCVRVYGPVKISFHTVLGDLMYGLILIKHVLNYHTSYIFMIRILTVPFNIGYESCFTKRERVFTRRIKTHTCVQCHECFLMPVCTADCLLRVRYTKQPRNCYTEVVPKLVHQNMERLVYFSGNFRQNQRELVALLYVQYYYLVQAFSILL